MVLIAVARLFSLQAMVVEILAEEVAFEQKESEPCSSLELSMVLRRRMFHCPGPYTHLDFVVNHVCIVSAFRNFSCRSSVVSLGKIA